MQAQTMSKGPPSQPSTLPPLQNLPSWSRSSLERRRQPRSLARNPAHSDSHEEKLSPMPEQDQIKNARTETAPSKAYGKDLNQKVTEMEKSLDFVQNQHAQVLENLHEEIERLKADNKDLNFKLVMSRSGVNLEEISPAPSVDFYKERTTTPVDEIRDKKISYKELNEDKQTHKEKKKKDLPKSAKIETKNNTINATPPNAKKRISSGNNSAKSTPPSSADRKAGSATVKSKFLTKARTKQIQKEAPLNTPSSNAKTEQRRRTPQTPIWSSVHGGQQMLMVTLNKDKTVQVHVPTENGPRSPTLSECKTIIIEQQEINHKQTRELLKLRSDLKDAITTQKWNSNNYLVGKSFGKMEVGPSHSSAGAANTNRHLPRLPFREPNSGRLPGVVSVPGRVALPALRPNINSVVADRRRRQQAILRGRMGKRDFS